MSTAPNGATIVHVAGDLDLATADMLEDVLGRLDAPSRLVLDLGECGFVDSSGMRVLVGTQETVANARVDIVTADSGILRALQIARLDTMFAIHPSLEAALEG